MDQKAWESLDSSERHSKVVLAISEYAYAHLEAIPYCGDRNAITQKVITIAQQTDLVTRITEFVNRASLAEYSDGPYENLISKYVSAGCNPIIESVASSEHTSSS